MVRAKRSNWVGRLVHRLNDPKDGNAAWTLAGLLLVAEAIFCAVIIMKVPYTEIDWVAYMQEVRGYQAGERDYSKLKGDTGPLVYPAGFVYLFAWLRDLTGEAILPAQIIFAALYIATQATVMALYIRSRAMPPWSLALLCCSRRLHSIFVLRLFNDCWAMFVAYVATLVLQTRRWPLAILLFSLAVSVKMNVLLMAPGVLAAVIKSSTPYGAARGVAAGVLLQVMLGAPFLAAYPASYLARAFELTRVFTYTWTVNWHFLPEEWFVSGRFALFMMALHARLLWYFSQRQWFVAEGGFVPAMQRFYAQGFQRPAAPTAGASAKGKAMGKALNDDTLLWLVFTSNFVGVVCARSLHYQFYSWYFHMLPFLLLRTQLPRAVSVMILVAIEVVWNVYPPRPWTSAMLQVLHLVALAAVMVVPAAYPLDTKTIGRRTGKRN